MGSGAAYPHNPKPAGCGSMADAHDLSETPLLCSHQSHSVRTDIDRGTLAMKWLPIGVDAED
jgi:hypothetical protein